MSRTRRSARCDRVHGIVPLEDLALDLGELLLGEHAGVANHRQQVERDAVRRLRSFEGRHGGPPRTGSRRFPRFPRCPLKSRRDTKISKCVRFRDRTRDHDDTISRADTQSKANAGTLHASPTPVRSASDAIDLSRNSMACAGTVDSQPNSPMTGQAHPVLTTIRSSCADDCRTEPSRCNPIPEERVTPPNLPISVHPSNRLLRRMIAEEPCMTAPIDPRSAPQGVRQVTRLLHRDRQRWLRLRHAWR